MSKLTTNTRCRKSQQYKQAARQFSNDNSTKLINYLKVYEKESTKPLTLEEERELISRYKDSNPEKLKDLLIIHNIRLVFQIAKKYSLTSKDFDEMIARGLEGLAYSTSKFDFNKGSKFSTYASRWIRKSFLKEFNTREIRYDKRQKEKEIRKYGEDFYDKEILQQNSQHQSYYDSLSSDFNASIQPIYDSHKEYLIREIKQIVDDKMKFTPEEYEVYERLILSETSVRQVARDLNLSVYNTNKIKKRVIGNIQSALEDRFHCPLEEIY